MCDSIAGKTGEKQRGAGRGGEAPGAKYDAREKHGLFIVTAERGGEPWVKRGVFPGQLACLFRETGLGALVVNKH